MCGDRSGLECGVRGNAGRAGDPGGGAGRWDGRRPGRQGGGAAHRGVRHGRGGAERARGPLAAVDADGLRRQRAGARARRREGRGRGAARVHGAPPLLPQRRGPRPRGHVPDHAARARRGLAVRDGERRALDGGRGRPEADRAPRVRRLPAPPPGSGAAREGGREPVHREGVPDRAPRREAPRRRLQPGAARGAVRAAAARVAEDRARRGRARGGRDRRRAHVAAPRRARLAARSRLRGGERGASPPR